ncbi:hypothetical protein U9M48_039906 [Paspalum notatum var. saurae]|uniref:Uncharacterized protein n=1 Tax=Paspalum notatum var. saurae TaxID=547442 RepID=A0AAQ3XF19_PASNO
MKTKCSHLNEDDPLLRSSIHALKHAMEVVSLLLPLLSMGVETMVGTPRRSPMPRQGCSPMGSCAQRHRRLDVAHVISSAINCMLFALRINVCEQQQEYLCGRQV